MAINKEINNTTKTHGAMRNCIEYVLGDAKVREDLIVMTGPSPTDINWNSVYKSFVDEKKLWGKDRGRMYRHSVISFHPDEKITVEEAFDFAGNLWKNGLPDFRRCLQYTWTKIISIFTWLPIPFPIWTVTRSTLPRKISSE